jgi:hypothetical protein
MIAVGINVCALYRDDLTLHRTSGSGVLDQQEGRRTKNRKCSRCRFSFMQLNPIPVCQPGRLIALSKNFHHRLKKQCSR